MGIVYDAIYHPSKVLNLAGFKFGRLTVLSRAEDTRNGTPRWNCRCDCGNFTSRDRRALVAPSTVEPSCGCAHAVRVIHPPEERLHFYRYQTYLVGAKKRGYEWGLSFEQFIDITTKPCTYCGAPPETRPRSNGLMSEQGSSGIDRVDNSIGYVIGNVTPCCSWCNYTKHSRTVMEFIDLCRRKAKITRHSKPQRYRAVAAQFPEVGL